MPERNSSAYQVKLAQIFFGLIFFVVGLYGVKSAMSGSWRMLRLIVASSFLGGLVFALDRRYWLLLPVAHALNLRVPGLPFDGIEFGCLALVAVHGIRVAFRRGNTSGWTPEVLVTLPMFFWMTAVFILNPVGLAMFGSETIGARFYFRIAIGFLAFQTLVSLRLSEDDARMLFWSLLACAFLHAIIGVFPSSPTVPEAVGGGTPAFELQAGSRYYLIPFGDVYKLLFAGWTITEILRVPLRGVCALTSAALMVLSGKRQIFAEIALIPILRAVLTRKERLATFVCGLLCSVVLLSAIAGDNSFYSLPASAKRALAVLVPRYSKSEVDGGTEDLFRAEVRKYAYQLIRGNPWFGRKGFAMNFEETAWMHFGGGSTGLFEGHAYAGNWHNMWLAYACDFGLPCLVFVIFLWLYIIRFVFRACRTVTLGRYLPACCMFYSFDLLLTAIFGWYAGHASLSTQSTFVQFGFLIAIFKGYQTQYSSRVYATLPSVSFEQPPLRNI